MGAWAQGSPCSVDTTQSGPDPSGLPAGPPQPHPQSVEGTEFAGVTAKAFPVVLMPSSP